MLTDTDILASPVVANSCMNRSRSLSGVNSYARELHFDISAFLARRVNEHGSAAWYDACCGEGRALVQAREQFACMDWGDKVRMIGVDLVDMFASASPGGEFFAADVLEFSPCQPIDLITNVHGLHYLGDKLRFIEQAYRQLTPGGVLLAHIDTTNLRSAGPTRLWAKIDRCLRSKNITFSLRRHILSIARTDAPLDFGAIYQGASVSEKPNYTGITVIDSWYTLI